jgi:hypothetical protein
MGFSSQTSGKMLSLVRLVGMFAIAIALNAQETTPPPAEPAAPTVPASSTDAPPSPIGTTPKSDASTDTVVDDQTPPANPGPGILSRTFTTTPLENEQLRFRPYVSLSGIADNGLIGPSQQASGHLTNTQNYGVDVGFGVTGRRLYKHDTFELEFNGDAFAYSPSSTYDGGNYLLMATYTHEFNRKISLAFNENASLYTNNSTIPNSTTDLSLGGTSQLVNPNTQIFDNTTLSLSTGVDLVIQETNRLSFDFGGNGFLVHRDSSLLYGTVGGQARADVNYRLTRHVTIGAYYGFTDYDFSNAFGGSQTHTAGAEYSQELTKSLQLRLRVGGSRVVTIGTQTIVLDPVIAAILGETSGEIAIHRTNYVPDLTAQFAKQFKVGTASLEFIENVTPGNGLVLTSRHTLYSGHYDYSGLRRWTISIAASRDQLNTLGILIGTYASYIGHAGIARTITRGFQANLFGEYRHYDLSQVAFLRNAYRVGLGFTWTPGERPIKFN